MTATAHHITSLAGLSSSELEHFHTHGGARRWRAGDIVFREGDHSADVYVVEQGHLKVSCSLPSGQELVLAVFGPGEMVGELAALDGRPRSATLSTIEPAVTVSMDSQRFEQFLLEHPSRAVSLLRIVSRRLREADQRSVEHAAIDLPGRLAARLCELSVRFGRQTPVDSRTAVAAPRGSLSISVSHEELAAWTASSREAVSKVIAVFRTEGLIDTGRRQVIVHDVPALRRRSQIQFPI